MTQIPSPQENDKFYGHTTAEQNFLNAYNATRVHHAWLISGPKGIGKATLAYRIARFLLADDVAPLEEEPPALFDLEAPEKINQPTLSMSSEHPIFHRVAVNGHLDLSIVNLRLSDDEKRMPTVISVDQIREIGGSLSLTPAEGGWRVVIIDGAENLNTNAANALLKILEEPPQKVIFLLVCHIPSRLIPTIRSRCSHIKLLPLPAEIIDILLQSYVPELNNDDRKMLIRLSDGSIGRALELSKNEGLSIQSELITIFDSFPEIDIEATHKFADLIARRENEKHWQTTKELITRNIADLIKSTFSKSALLSLRYGEVELASLTRLQKLGSPKQWTKVWEDSFELFSIADNLNLDRKEVVLSIFGAMANIAETRV
ncbi:MAG: DNA polymerase III subunit delta' [Pseudomonadota bacterium]|nr:DNA polymerase III subunit delta' [Pseudomonadota bacterium]